MENRDFWLVKTDSYGNVDWNQTYGTADVEVAESLVQTSDGGYTLAGNQQIWVHGEQKFLVVRTNIQGVPEFPSWIIIPLFLTATVSAIVFKKRLFCSSP